MNDKVFRFLLLFLALLCFSGSRFSARKPIRISGTTMGTTYHITYFDTRNRNFKPSVDSLLRLVNNSINNYDPQSEVSRFNRASKSYRFQLPYFYPPLKTAKEVFDATAGAFDLTVMPLVNAWGFGQLEVNAMDSIKIDSLKSTVGFNKVSFNADSIVKTDGRVQVDFGGIGQGYGADVVASFLTKKGIKNMLIELGGEGMALGMNVEKGTPWEIGVLDPRSDYAHQWIKATVKLKDRSFTTSGSYVNVKELNGVTYSHIINPVTGHPVKHGLLSVSIFAKDAATADAWDTALMVLGVAQSIDLLQKHPELDGFLIYVDSAGNLQTYTTPGITPYLTLMPKQ
jgi:thiamine biosynthesis lipoprotein